MVQAAAAAKLTSSGGRYWRYIDEDGILGGGRGDYQGEWEMEKWELVKKFWPDSLAAGLNDTLSTRVRQGKPGPTTRWVKEDLIMSVTSVLVANRSFDNNSANGIYDELIYRYGWKYAARWGLHLRLLDVHNIVRPLLGLNSCVTKWDRWLTYWTYAQLLVVSVTLTLDCLSLSVCSPSPQSIRIEG